MIFHGKSKYVQTIRNRSVLKISTPNNFSEVIQMKLLIKPNAGTIFVQNHYRRKGRQHVMSNEARKFGDMITAIEGMEIKVETKYLWKDQFNTAPIEGISKNGLRILDFEGDESIIEKIIDDVRPQRKTCDSCGNYARDGDLQDDPCWWCGHHD